MTSYFAVPLNYHRYQANPANYDALPLATGSGEVVQDPASRTTSGGVSNSADTSTVDHVPRLNDSRWVLALFSYCIIMPELLRTQVLGSYA